MSAVEPMVIITILLVFWNALQSLQLRFLERRIEASEMRERIDG